MFSGKYTSLNRVIENISRDYEYENQLYKDDVTEWAVRAMNLIGVNLIYNTVVTKLSILNFKSIIPANVIDIIMIRDSVTKETLIPSTDEFITSLVNEKLENVTAVAGKNINTTIIPAYKVTNGYIFFNFEKGDVDLKYTEYATDTNGCLLIPDIDRYLMAIEAYIVYKIDSKLYRRGLLHRDIKLESEQNWLWYVNSAANKLITPDYNVAENLSRQSQSIRKSLDSHSRGFGTLNYPTVKRF